MLVAEMKPRIRAKMQVCDLMAGWRVSCGVDLSRGMVSCLMMQDVQK